MYNHFHRIPKSKIDRIEELYHSLRIIHDCLGMIRKGNYYHIGVIYAQLRALLTDMATPPLLPLVAELVGDDLDFYYLKRERDFPEMVENMNFELVGPPLTLKRTLPKQTKITITDYLEKHVLTVKDQKIRVNTLISHLANNHGGAHYSKSLPKYLVDMLNFGINNQPVINHYIIQLAELCFELGANIIRKITEFDLYFNLYLPSNKVKNEQFLFDFKIPHLSNRISLVFNQSRYHLLVIDTLGRKFSKTIDELVPEDDFYLVNISHTLSPNFTSEFKCFFNEVSVIQERMSDPFLVLNDFVSYDRYFNRSISNTNKKFQFGMLEFLAYGKPLNYIDKLKMFNYLESKEDETAIWFSGSSYGYCKAGNKNMKMFGEVKQVDLAEFIKK